MNYKVAMNNFIQKFINREKLSEKLRVIWIAVFPYLLVAFLIVFTLFIVPFLQELSITGQKMKPATTELKNDASYKKELSTLNRDLQRLTRTYNAFTSGQSYLVINTTDNRFHLFRNKKLVREGFCSSGSYKLLQTLQGQQWIFKTPKGKFQIQGKTVDPIWKRPDWAFVEEGLPIPSSDHSSRFEYGVLGDYALALGDGYLIHGTIYQRLLGMPVTHGCVRLNDDDLEAVFHTLNIGSKVYIF